MTIMSRVYIDLVKEFSVTDDFKGTFELKIYFATRDAKFVHRYNVNTIHIRRYNGEYSNVFIKASAVSCKRTLKFSKYLTKHIQALLDASDTGLFSSWDAFMLEKLKPLLDVVDHVIELGAKNELSKENTTVTQCLEKRVYVYAPSEDQAFETRTIMFESDESVFWSWFDKGKLK